MNICTIYTGRIGLDDPNTLDITIKSATAIEGQVLAPTWAMVNGLKEGSLTEAQYQEQYLDLLRKRYRDTPYPFHTVLDKERVVLVCYCNLEGSQHYCHRQTAAEVLRKIGAARGQTVVLAGEIQPPVKQLGMFDEKLKPRFD